MLIFLRENTKKRVYISKKFTCPSSQNTHTISLPDSIKHTTMTQPDQTNSEITPEQRIIEVLEKESNAPSKQLLKKGVS
jgi:hypothetical protein